MKTPFSRSYWVVPGLLAGSYPGHKLPDAAHQKIAGLASCGVKLCINLMESGELDGAGGPFAPYEDAARQEGIACMRLDIPADGLPTVARMEKIVATIEKTLAYDNTVYVHCRDGRGRTGLVVACWLVFDGMTAPAALEHLAWLRREAPGQEPPSQTEPQRAFVVQWERMLRP